MIFISYSRKNMDLLQGFRIHLRALFDEKDLFWTDNEIKADQQWDQEIKTALKDCKIAVMLISPTFLASGYIRDQEIPILLERRESEQIKLTSLYLVDSVVGHDDAAFKINVNGRERSIKLTEYQGLNTPGAPIAKFTRNHRAEEYKKAAINFKGLWDSVHHPSFPAQKTDRKQLTVTLENYSKRLYRCFYYRDQKVEGRSLPWDDRFTALEKWNGDWALSSSPENFGDALFYALFGDDQSCRELLAKVREQKSAHSNATSQPLRLKIYTPDPLLARLPWQKTTWQRQSLIQWGWSFEMIPFHPSDGFPSRDLCIKTPLPIQLILPDSGALNRYAASHYESLGASLNRIWSGQPYHKPRHGSKWQEVCGDKSHDTQSIVYFYGSASWRDDRMTLDFSDARVDLNSFKKSLGRHSPPKIVFLNLCREFQEPITELVREFSQDIDLVIVQTFHPDLHFDAELAAIQWFNAVLGQGSDPVEAINRCGIGHAMAWSSYNQWTAVIGQDAPGPQGTGQTAPERPSRKTISKNALDSLRDPKMRVIASVAYGSTSNLLHLFHQQIGKTLRDDLKTHATVHQTELRFGADAASPKDIQEELFRAMDKDPRKKLAGLCENQLKIFTA